MCLTKVEYWMIGDMRSSKNVIEVKCSAQTIVRTNKVE